jgi:probable phosphoglycerate mutase
VFKQWQESPETICPPDGEAICDAMERIRKALEKPLKKKGNLAFVAAEPLASIIASLIREVPLDNVSRFGPPPCGTWEIVREIPGKVLTGELLVSPDLAAARAP